MDRLRHRDRLLSLKYSTIEACFSVPMLNLTLPNMPFVVAFAAKALGWKAASVGLMAALPHFCNCFQPVLLAGLSRKLSAFRLMLLTFSVGGAAWLVSPLLPFVGPWRGFAFASILVAATLASSVASVAWSSSISEVVPQRLGGRYFARRNLIFGAWTLIAVMAAGHFAEWNGNSLAAFTLIFCAAGLSRITGMFFLTRMKFPQAVKERRSRAIALADLLAVVRNPNYLWLCLFVGVWGLMLNAGMPFYTVFLLNKLQFGVGDVVKLTTLASLGGLVTLKAWGRLCERFGNRPVLQVAALIWGVTALAMWLLARPGWTWHLYFGYLVVGAMTAGFQLVQFNLMVRLAPPDLRPAYVAVFIAITSLLTALGPILGGQALKHLPAEIGHVLGAPIFNFHLLFALSGLGCLAATACISSVREPDEQPVLNVWQEMRTMRTFNPMLSVMAVGELMLTPRGLFALAQNSLRSVRQQVKAIEDVGEEIALGGRQILQKSSRIWSPGAPGSQTAGVDAAMLAKAKAEPRARR